MADLNQPGPSNPSKGSKYDHESCLICKVVLTTDLISQHYHYHMNESTKQLNKNNEERKKVEKERNKLRTKKKLVIKKSKEIKRQHQLAKEALWQVQQKNLAGAEGA